MADRVGNDEPNHKNLRNSIGKLLGGRFAEILEYLVEELEQDATSGVTRQRAILLGLDELFSGLDAEMRDEVEKVINEAFKDGQRYLYKAIEEARNDEEAQQMLTFNQLQADRVEAVFSDTFNDLLQATNLTKENIKQVVRDTTRDIQRYHSLRNSDMRSRYKDLENSLTRQGLNDRIKEQGFVGVVDKAGRNWKTSVYSKMVTRTKVREAYLEGVRTESDKNNIDLAVISSHDADDECIYWEGVVISLNGKTEGYPTMDEAKGTGQIWHPNCLHYVSPITRFDNLHEDEKDIHKQKIDEMSKRN